MTCAFALCKDRETHYILWKATSGATRHPYQYCKDHFDLLFKEKTSLIVEAGEMPVLRTAKSVH